MITALTVWVWEKIAIDNDKGCQRLQAFAVLISFCFAGAQDIALIAWLWR